jgi:hypothetical protein
MKHGVFSMVCVCSLWLFVKLSVAAHAQISPFVDAVPSCGGSVYENGNLVVAYGCNIPVYITWSSDGDVWGAAHLNAGGRQDTGQSAGAVARAGGVRLFACPGDSTPEGTDGRPVGPHYRGQYRCRR